MGTATTSRRAAAAAGQPRRRDAPPGASPSSIRRTALPRTPGTGRLPRHSHSRAAIPSARVASTRSITSAASAARAPRPLVEHAHPPDVMAPMASFSPWPDAQSCTEEHVEAANSAWATSNATGTPPRGRASTSTSERPAMGQLCGEVATGSRDRDRLRPRCSLLVGLRGYRSVPCRPTPPCRGHALASPEHPVLIQSRPVRRDDPGRRAGSGNDAVPCPRAGRARDNRTLPHEFLPCTASGGTLNVGVREDPRSSSACRRELAERIQ